VDRIRALGAELVFIGNGASHFARGFREDFAVPGPIWVDPGRESYRALGFASGLGSTLGWRVLSNAQRARRAGFSQRSVEGHAIQQGGVLVVLPSGEIAYRYASEAAGDHPPVEEVISALEQALGAG
jgi:hypothetical protein